MMLCLRAFLRYEASFGRQICTASLVHLGNRTSRHAQTANRRPPANQPAASRALTCPSQHECWSCKYAISPGGMICPQCESIQQANTSASYFEVMGIKAEFDVDLDNLEKAYKSLQWQLHPDRAAGKPPLEQGFAAQQASFVNIAYSVLRQPLPRAKYMLELAGGDTSSMETKTISDQGFLMEVLEAREAVAESEDAQQLLHLLSEVHKQSASVQQSLSAAFAAGDIDAAQELVVQLTYITKLVEEIQSKLPAS